VTIGATVQRVFRREPLSEELQNPGGWRRGPAFHPENNRMNARVDLSSCCAMYRTKRGTNE
jgi:hypothetical protein